jgi:hypothetical protein
MLLIRRSLAVVTSAALVLTLSSACRGTADDEPPVATPSLTLNYDRVPIGSPLTVTYRFEVAQGASIDDDYWVFVHVLDPDGERLWNDDHQPPRPTSTWQPGEVVEYSRTLFVPTYPYIGEGVVRLGLYKGTRRLPLAGTEATRREYVVARLQILPQSENIFRIYRDGWHMAEVASDDPATEWQWTTGTATLSFRNPKSDVLFYLESDARPDLFPEPQLVTIRVHDQVVGSFRADSRERRLQTFPITAAQLGNGEMVELVIDIDRTFRPQGGDPRELGIRVFNTFIDARREAD